MLTLEQKAQAERWIPEHLREVAKKMLESSDIHTCKRRRSLTLHIVAQLYSNDVVRMKRWLDDICNCLQASMQRYMSMNDMLEVWTRMTRECGEAALKFKFPTHYSIPKGSKPRAALTKLRADWIQLRENVLRLIDLRMIWLAENGYLGTITSTDGRTCVIRFSTANVKQATRGGETTTTMERVDHAHFVEWPRVYRMNAQGCDMPARTRNFWHSVPNNLQPFFGLLQGTLIRQESQVTGSTSVVVKTLRRPDPALLFGGYVLDAWSDDECLDERRMEQEQGRFSCMLNAVWLASGTVLLVAMLFLGYHRMMIGGAPEEHVLYLLTRSPLLFITWAIGTALLYCLLRLIYKLPSIT